jgi:5-methylcytosine-specific restriction endonuclease McrA
MKILVVRLLGWRYSMAIVYNDNDVAGKVCNKCGEWKPITEFSRQTANLKKGGDGFYYTCKKCHSVIRRAHYAANHERINAYQRAYYRSHREEIITANREYRQANIEKVKAAHRAYYYRNRERRKQAQRERSVGRRASQPEQVRSYYRSYYRAQKQANPEKVRRHERIQERRRRNLKLQVIGSHTEVEWEALKVIYNYTCLCCGKSEPEIILTRDHIVPIVKGGSDWITNIQPLCPSCNSSKGIKIINYRLNWSSDPSGGNPADQ